MQMSCLFLATATSYLLLNREISYRFDLDIINLKTCEHEWRRQGDVVDMEFKWKCDDMKISIYLRQIPN